MGGGVRAPPQAGTPTACPHEAPTHTAGTQHIPRSAQASAPLEVGQAALKPVACHGRKPRLDTREAAGAPPSGRGLRQTTHAGLGLSPWPRLT